MTQYDNNMTGIVSKNDRKETEQHPDIRGNCEIDGVQYWISGWRKQRKDGNGSFYSLKFKAKDAPPPRPASKQAPAPQNGGLSDMDDDIPF